MRSNIHFECIFSKLQIVLYVVLIEAFVLHQKGGILLEDSRYGLLRKCNTVHMKPP